MMESLLTRTALLTRPEVAEILRLKVATIKAKTARGEIPSVKMGRAVRYRPEDVYRYIVEHTRQAAISSSASPELDNSP
jgi:excisionase family DNA binding protein